MKKIFKKLICLLLVCVLLIGTLSACKEKTESKPKPQKENSLNSGFINKEEETIPSESDESVSFNADDVEIIFTNHNEYSSFGIPDEVNELIKSYFTIYFKALGSYIDLTVDEIFSPDAQYQSNIVNAMISYQNGIRLDMDIDMKYKEANVGVKYISYTPTDKGYDVYLVQNDYMNYNFIPDVTSYTSDIEHHFIVNNVDGKYLISEHREITGTYDLIVKGFNKYTEELEDYDTAEIFSIVKDWYFGTTDRELSKILIQRDEYNASPDDYITSISADNIYDREAALKYSYKWAGKTEAVRNLTEYGMYDLYGGNCNNFTSQCLFAGGIPMDLQGVQWKWYSEGVNEFGGKYGRSPSWAECDYFYNYCITNEGYGLVTDTDCNLYSGKPGDLIQYLVDETDAVHTVIITKVIYDEDGNVIDYLINSNTIDKVDCPMSAYGYTNFRLIKIIGWNN